MEGKTIVISGLRSHKLFGTNYSNKKYSTLILKMMGYLKLHPEITKVYIGMATGIDLLFGLAVINFNKRFDKDIKLIACIPGIGQTKYFTPREVEMYAYILKQPCTTTRQLSKEYCTAEVLKERNKVMIEEADELLAFWDGVKYKSGTYSAVAYARKIGKPVTILNPFELVELT